MHVLPEQRWTRAIYACFALEICNNNILNSWKNKYNESKNVTWTWRSNRGDFWNSSLLPLTVTNSRVNSYYRTEDRGVAILQDLQFPKESHRPAALPGKRKALILSLLNKQCRWRRKGTLRIYTNLSMSLSLFYYDYFFCWENDTKRLQNNIFK